MVRLLAPQVVVDGPPATPPPHGLRDSAREIPEVDNRWEAGMTFCPETCMTVHSFNPACDQGTALAGGTFDDADARGTCPFIQPYQLYVPFTCDSVGMLSRDDEGRARRALEAGTSKGMEKAFWADLELTDNFSLTGKTPNVQGDAWLGTNGILNAGAAGAPTPVAALQALAMVSEALGQGGLGGRGMIHASPWIVELWAAGGGLVQEDGRLQTRSRGDIIVAGSGYQGTGPTGNASATPPAGTRWIYGTGMVEYRLSPIEFVADTLAQILDRRQNGVTWVAQRTVGHTVDPCNVFAVLVSL